MQLNRFADNPIITPAPDESIGANINGPSLLRVPGWLPNPPVRPEATTSAARMPIAPRRDRRAMRIRALVQ